MTGEDLEDLMRSHGARLLAALSGVVGDRAKAEDLCQEAWLAVWNGGQGIVVQRHDAWPLIRSIGFRKAIDFRRRRERESKAVAEAAARAALAERAQPPSMRALHAGLASLAVHERAALVLFFWEALSVIEIAEVLEAPPATVKTWMYRGRKALREKLMGVEEVQ